VIALLVVAALLLLPIAIRLFWPAVRRRRTPAELRGDWWPQFEREFRAYALRATVGRDRHRRRTGKQSPQS
jgi:hypothetical protein